LVRLDISTCRIRRLFVPLAVGVLTAIGTLSAGCSGDECSSDGDCSGEAVCLDGQCGIPEWKINDIGTDGPAGTPALEAPESVRFEVEQPGETDDRVLDLRNTGDAPLRVTEIRVEGDASVFSFRVPGEEENSPPYEVAPERFQAVDVTFSPTERGMAQANLVVESSDPARPVARIRLVGEAREGAGSACLETSPSNTVEFGEVEVGQQATETVELTNCSSSQTTILDGVQIRGEIFEADLGESVQLAPGETHRQEVVFSPNEVGSASGRILFETEVLGPANPVNQTLDLRGTGTEPRECPVATAEVSADMESSSGGSKSLTVDARTTLSLDGTESSARTGSIERYEWSVIDRPTGSTAQLAPSTDAAEPTFLLDLVGSYKFELKVFDSEGNESCETAVVDATARAPGEIYVELSWTTPADPDATSPPGADLDLHYLNVSQDPQWNRSPWDVYWDNQTAEWGDQVSSRDNPRMLTTSADGTGPEVLHHPRPAEGDYSVGVYYFDDNGFGKSFATTRLYLNGQLGQEFSDQSFEQFWFRTLATYDWPAGAIPVRDKLNKSGFPTR